ncbi:MAG: hypothetical protein WA485_25820 [Candidatus Sulfotelmatobacter sp.]
MNTDRRDFLQYSSLAALSPTLSLLKADASPQDQTVLNQNIVDYWMSRVSAPYHDFLSPSEAKGVTKLEPRNSVFLFPSVTKGLVPAGTLDTSDIANFPEDGNKDVTIRVERFRPSPADSTTLAKLQSGTLRIDVKQVTPLPGLPEALAWTAMATLASRDKNQSIPSLNNIKFDPGTVWGQFQSIPLTDGQGFWSWNFFMKKREGFWGQLLDTLFKTLDTAQPLLPILGLPGIAVSGLKYVDQIVGGIQAQGESQWLFSGLDIAVCATKKSFDSAGAKGARKLPLTTGSYVIMPEDNVGDVQSDWVIQDGLLVHGNTDPRQIYNDARTILPNASYMTISVAVSDSKTKSADTTKGAK